MGVMASIHNWEGKGNKVHDVRRTVTNEIHNECD